MDTKRIFITKCHFFAFVTLFIITTSMIANKAAATNYYVSAVGNDVADGLTLSTPWKTILKVNSAFSTINPGDEILFNRGDTFYGTLKITKSGMAGSPIIIGAYGTGDNPIITGFTAIAGWIDEGGGIYSKVITSEAQTNMVTIDGVQYGMGRWPDATYNTFESHVTNTAITDIGLGDIIDWVGAEVVIRKNDWTLDRCLITDHTGDKITYTNLGSTQDPRDNFGYFIQNDLRCVTKYGEWYHNISTGKFYIYFGTVNPNNIIVKVATINNLVFANGNDYITIDGINFVGSIATAVNFNYGHDYCNIQNCNVSFAGKNGISILSLGTNNLINNNIFRYCNNFGIINSDGVSTTITNNRVLNIGNIAGQALGADGYVGISTYGGTSNVSYNIIRNTGYNGMTVWRQGSTTIQYNLIDTVCTVLDDGAGIYTAGPSTTLPRLIDHNIILNVVGNIDGKISPHFSTGIYLDESASNVTVTDNTIANSQYAGIYLHKAKNNIVTDNTSFNNTYGIDFQDFVGDQIRSNSLRRNKFFAKTLTQYAVHWYTITNDISSFGVADSNFYTRPIDDNLVFYLKSPLTGYVYKNLEGWQSFSSQDAHSKKSPISVADVNNIRFEYNPTNANITISLDSKYVSLDSKIYNGTIILQPYSSAILMKYSGNLAPSIINQIFQIPKNSTNGAFLGTVIASDPDTDQTLTYSILSGNINGAFAINATTGALTVLNSAVLGSNFDLVVKVQDNGIVNLSNQATITMSIITGIELNGSNKTIKVYPNPVSNELIIEIGGNDRPSFEIQNSNGLIVFKGNLSKKTVVETSNFSPGIYFIKIEHIGSFEVKKFVKM